MSQTTHDEASRETLEAVFQAFNRHDADGVMAHMSDNVVFEAIGGDESYGTRLVGQAAVKAAFEGVWSQYPDVQWRDHQHFACADRGVSEWTFTATQSDGSIIEAEGCDLFRFANGLIVEKKAFRKNRPSVSPRK